MAACIRCVFQCINTAAYESGGELAHSPLQFFIGKLILTGISHLAIQKYLVGSIPIADKALSHGSRTVQLPLYEELRLLLTRLDEWTSPQEGRKVDVHSLQEPLSTLAKELLIREIDVSVETIRRERAQSAVAYIVLSQQRGLEINNAIRESVQTWRAGERSGPVHQILDQALAKLAPQ